MVNCYEGEFTGGRGCDYSIDRIDRAITSFWREPGIVSANYLDIDEDIPWTGKATK